MTATDLPGLVVPIEARITALERGLQKANRAQQRAAAEMEGRAKKSADKIGDTYAAMGTRLAGVMSKALLPLGAALTSGAAIRGVAQIAEGLAKIGDEAARAGLGAEEFQQWAYVAEQARIPVDAMVDAFKELSLRADELLTTGAGPAAEAFRRIGFNATDLKRKLQDPSALMDEIIDRTEKLDRAARLRVFDEIFGGTGGERLVQLLDMGADKVRTMRDRAVDLGLVIDGDVIKKAAELDRKFSEITTRISTLAKTAVVELAEAIEDAFTVDVDEMFGGAERALAMLGEANYRALKDAPAILDDQKDAVNDLQAAYAELARIYNDLTGPTGFRLMDVADVDAAHELAGILVDIDREMQAFENGSQSAEEFQGNMQDLIQEAIDLLANLDAVDSARFTNVIDSINAMAGALANAAAKAREAASALAATLAAAPDYRARPEPVRAG